MTRRKSRDICTLGRQKKSERGGRRAAARGRVVLRRGRCVLRARSTFARCRSCFTTPSHFGNRRCVIRSEASALPSESEDEMKKASWMLSAAAAVTLLTTLGAVTAGAEDRRIVADVPFDFIVQDMLLPAGDYVITERA